MTDKMTNPTEEKKVEDILYTLDAFAFADSKGKGEIYYKTQDVKEAISKLIKHPKLYTEDEVRQAAKGGAANERAHWMRKLQILRKFAGMRQMNASSYLDLLTQIDQLLVELSQAESDK